MRIILPDPVISELKESTTVTVVEETSSIKPEYKSEKVLESDSKKIELDEAAVRFNEGQDYEKRNLFEEAVICYQKAASLGNKNARERLREPGLWHAIDFLEELGIKEPLSTIAEKKEDSKQVGNLRPNPLPRTGENAKTVVPKLELPTLKLKLSKILTGYPTWVSGTASEPSWVKEYGIIKDIPSANKNRTGKDKVFPFNISPNSWFDSETDLLIRAYRYVLLRMVFNRHVLSNEFNNHLFITAPKLDNTVKCCLFMMLIWDLLKIKYDSKIINMGGESPWKLESERKDFLKQNHDKVYQFLHQSSVYSLFPKASVEEKAQIRYTIEQTVKNGAYWMAKKSTFRFIGVGKKLISSAFSASNYTPEQELQEAINWFRDENIQLYSKNADIYYTRGDANFLLGNEEIANNSYSEALKIDPKSTPSVKTLEDYLLRGKVIINELLKSRKFELEYYLRPFEAALKLDEKNSEALLGKGCVLLIHAINANASDNTNFEQAKIQLETALSLNPKSANGHFMLANVLIRFKSHPSALEHLQLFQQYKQTSPSEYDYYSLLQRNFGGESITSYYYKFYSLEAGILHCSSEILKSEIELYATAAKAEDADSQFKYGFSLETGFGSFVYYDEAAKWYEKAASTKHPLALFRLAMCYEDGRGVKKDKEKAHSLFIEALPGVREAADKGDNHALIALGLYYESGWAQVEKNPGKAFKFFQAAADKNFIPAQYQVARCLLNGIGVAKNEMSAANLFKQAALKGFPRAQLNYGWNYVDGKGGVPKNHKLAVEWLKLGAQHSHPECQYWLGQFYETQKDNREAAYWYRRAAVKDNTEAQLKIGLYYLNGTGVDKDAKEAVAWLQKAVDMDSTEAMFHLADCYQYGKGVAKDPKIAIKLYRKAADAGNTTALHRLASPELKPIVEFLRQEEVAEKLLKDLKLELNPQRSEEKSPSALAAARDAKASSPEIAIGVSFEIPYSDLTRFEKVGQGGFGIVYRGEWRRTPVAIKELHAFSSKESIEEFRREGKIMVELRHPNIVQFCGYCPDPRCLVMEWMPNGSLYSMLHSDRSLDPTMKYRFVVDIAKGLDFLHACKPPIVHRDLKSLNILLDEFFRAKICDFGLSKIKSETRATSTVGGAIGTPAWMAPELLKRGAEYTPKADIYSFAIVMWEIYTRKVPFADAPNPGLILMWVASGEREKIPEDCPKKIASLIQACWKERPEGRPTASDIVEYLNSPREEFEAKSSASASAGSATSQAMQHNFASQSSSAGLILMS